MLGHNGGGIPFDAEDLFNVDDTEAYRDDPILKLDLQAELIRFFKEAARNNAGGFNGLLEGGALAKEEMLVVQGIVGGA